MLLAAHSYLGVDWGHISLGHVAYHNLVVGAVEQLIVLHHTVHDFGHLVLFACRGVSQYFGLPMRPVDICGNAWKWSVSSGRISEEVENS